MNLIPLAYIISFCIGYSFIRLILTSDNFSQAESDAYMHLVLSLPIGMGISSLLLFYSFLICGKAIFSVFLIVHLSFLAVLLILNYRRFGNFCDIQHISLKPKNFKWFLINSFLLFYVFVLALPFFEAYPYGLWDALSCWNLKARLMLFSDNWLKAFSPSIRGLNYPILLPLNIAWGWLFGSGDSPLGPMFVATIYAFSIILFIFFSISRYCGLKKALLISLFLINVRNFLIVMVLQYGDIALSCYNTIGVVCCFIAMREKRMDYMLLGELALGFGALTKNEGLLLFVVINLVMFFNFLLYNKSLLKLLSAGLKISLFPLFTLLIIKRLAYYPEKIFLTEGVTIALLLSKTKVFFLFILSNIFKIDSWSLFWYIFLIFIIFYHRKIFKSLRAIIILTVFGVFAGYFTVYILKIELPLQVLDYSYQRFIMHLLPLLCFLIADSVFYKGEVDLNKTTISG